MAEDTGFGPTARTQQGTFASLSNSDDTWTVLPVSVRQSQKEHIKAKAESEGVSAAAWAREILLQALG